MVRLKFLFCFQYMIDYLRLIGIGHIVTETNHTWDKYLRL